MGRRIMSSRGNTRTKAIQDWLWWQSSGLLVVLFVFGKVFERLVMGRHWHSFGRLELFELGVLALAVGTATWYVRQHVQRHVAALERERRRLEVLTAENAAVIRAVGAAVRELAQPLSGVLSYSELMLLSEGQGSARSQQEVEGLREGALLLEQLVRTLRQTIDGAAASDAESHVRLADAVERSVTAPRSRIFVHPRPHTSGSD